LVIGKWYKFTAGYRATGGAAVLLRVNNGALLDSTGPIGSSGILSIVFAATGTDHPIYLLNLSSAADIYSFWDNVSIKELAGNHAVAPSDAARPLYKVTGLAKWNDFDAVDDVLNTTFPSSLGSSCTVARANVGSAATILTARTIGTSYANSIDNAGLVITNDALTTQETADLTAWLTAKGATS